MRDNNGFIYEIGCSVRYASVGIVVFQSATYSIGSLPTHPAILRVSNACQPDIIANPLSNAQPEGEVGGIEPKEK